MSMKNSNDTIGNRTLDLRTCTAVPQSTTTTTLSLSVHLSLNRWKIFASTSNGDGYVRLQYHLFTSNTGIRTRLRWQKVFFLQFGEFTVKMMKLKLQVPRKHESLLKPWEGPCQWLEKPWNFASSYITEGSYSFSNIEQQSQKCARPRQ